MNCTEIAEIMSRGVGGDKDLEGTVQRYKRINSNNTCPRQYCSRGDLVRKGRGLGSDFVREARYTVTDRRLHTEGRGIGGKVLYTTIPYSPYSISPPIPYHCQLAIH